MIASSIRVPRVGAAVVSWGAGLFHVESLGRAPGRWCVVGRAIDGAWLVVCCGAWCGVSLLC